jgi:hypothetical protein
MHIPEVVETRSQFHDGRSRKKFEYSPITTGLVSMFQRNTLRGEVDAMIRKGSSVKLTSR